MHRRARAPLALVLVLALAAALPACPRPLEPAALPAVSLPCPPPPEAPARQLRFSVFTAGDTAATRAAHMLAAAQAYWLRYGAALAINDRAPTRLAAVVTDVPDGMTPPDTLAALSLVLKPAFAFVRARAAESVAGSRVDVVLLPRLMSPGSAATGFFSRLDGFTLSPHHRDALADDAEVASLYAALGLADFRPTVFVAVPDEAVLPPGVADLRLAHEFGHVFGLDHAGGARRLMSNMRSRSACPELDEQERRDVSAAIDALAR